MTLESLRKVLPPPENVVAGGDNLDWSKVEADLGTSLPNDYKAFIATYGLGEICGNIHVFNPFSDIHNFIEQNKLQLQWLREFREEFPEFYQFNIYPEADGVLMWGEDCTGAYCFWITTGKPDEWKVALMSARGHTLEKHDLNMIDFLVKYATDDFESQIISTDICSPDPTFNHIRIDP